MTRYRLLAVLLAGLALPGIVAAQTPAPAGPEPSAEALKMARDLVAKTGGDRNATLQSIGAPMVGLMQQMGIKDPQRAQALVKEVVMPIVSEHYEGLVDLQSRAYAQTLSVADMKATLAFYDTAAGRDLIAAGPKLAQARVTSMTQWMGGLQPEMMAKMQSVMKEHGWDKPD